MKHLKTYENNNVNIKKYCCIKYVDEEDNSVDYYIDEVHFIHMEVVNYSILYEYYYKNDKFNIIEEKDQIESKSTVKDYTKNLFYTTDNLNECFEKVRLKVEADKYNL